VERFGGRFTGTHVVVMRGQPVGSDRHHHLRADRAEDRRGLADQLLDGTRGR
jgi:hypothetical protein